MSRISTADSTAEDKKPRNKQEVKTDATDQKPDLADHHQGRNPDSADVY